MSAEHRPSDLLVAGGTVEASGLKWRLLADSRATNRDLRAIAALLVAAADRLQRDPNALDERITV